MRELSVKVITEKIADMCIQANHYLSTDIDNALKNATESEGSPLGKKILNQLQENLQIASAEQGAQHGGEQTSLAATNVGGKITPSSTNDLKDWYVCQGWNVVVHSKDDIRVVYRDGIEK